jgi:hypothetical protein
LSERARDEIPEASLVIELGRYLVGEAVSMSRGSSTARFRVAKCS